MISILPDKAKRRTTAEKRSSNALTYLIETTLGSVEGTPPGWCQITICRIAAGRKDI
jgi:hypothetical protein